MKSHQRSRPLLQESIFSSDSVPCLHFAGSCFMSCTLDRLNGCFKLFERILFPIFKNVSQCRVCNRDIFRRIGHSLRTCQKLAKDLFRLFDPGAHITVSRFRGSCLICFGIHCSASYCCVLRIRRLHSRRCRRFCRRSRCCR